MEIKVKIPDELAAQAKAREIAVEEYVQELLALRASLRPNVGRLRNTSSSGTLSTVHANSALQRISRLRPECCRAALNCLI
jgi:hypothetical protein